MLLYCVRHGESAFNAQRRIQGQSDVPLSALGIRQSHALAAALSRRPIEAVYSSPLERALETARPVAAALGLDVHCDDRLMEIHAGIFQGKLWADIQQEYPAEAVRWVSDPDFIIPGGESRRTLMQRGQAAMETIRERGHKQVVVVSHGGLLTATFKAMLGIPAQRDPFTLYNAAINLLEWNREVRLLTLNQTDHLPQVDGQALTRGGDL